MSEAAAATMDELNEEGPVGVDRFWQPSRAAFLLYAFLLANGVFAISGLFFDAYRLTPQTVTLGIIVWGLYTVPFILAWRWLDFYELDLWGVAMAFAWGGLIATYLAIPANSAIGSLLNKADHEFAQRWMPAIAGPTTEETLKYLGVIAIFLIAKTQFRSILAFLILGVFVGLGFQIVEDMLYTVQAAQTWPTDDQVSPVAQMFFVRGLLSGLWSHPIYTAITSFGLGYALVRVNEPLAKRITVAVAFFALGWFGHFFWNSPLMNDWIGESLAIVGIFIKGIPMVMFALLLWWYAARSESTKLQSLAEYYVAEDLITPDERSRLGKLLQRRRRRKEVKNAHGVKAEHALTDLQRAQMQLVLSVAEDGPESAAYTERGAEARRHRRRLEAAMSAG